MHKWDAKGYSKNSRNQKRWAEALLNQIRFRGNENVLDIGCGDGEIACRISEKVPHGEVLGIDSSKGMVDYAWNRFKDKYKNVSFNKKDACMLGFNNRFDIAFSNACFHWIPDQDSLLESIYKALKPGGRLFVQMGAKGNFAGIVKISDRLICTKKWRQYFKEFVFPYHFFTTASYRKLLKYHGFKVNTMRTFINYMEYDNPEECKDSLRTIWIPYLQKVPEALREDLLAEAVAQYLKNYPPDKRGRVMIKMKRLEFQAEKPLMC